MTIGNIATLERPYGTIHSLPFTPNQALRKDQSTVKEHLQVSLWADMENREYPERKVLVSNLLHDCEALLL